MLLAEHGGEVGRNPDRFERRCVQTSQDEADIDQPFARSLDGKAKMERRVADALELPPARQLVIQKRRFTIIDFEVDAREHESVLGLEPIVGPAPIAQVFGLRNFEPPHVLREIDDTRTIDVAPAHPFDDRGRPHAQISNAQANSSRVTFVGAYASIAATA